MSCHKRFVSSLGHVIRRLRAAPPSERLPLLTRYFRKAARRVGISLPDPMARRLRDYLRVAYPSHPDVAIADMQAISGGWENEVYSFTARRGPFGDYDGETLVLRIFPSEKGPERAACEIRALTGLNLVGYPVPTMYHFEARDKSPFGKPFVIMERVQGRPMGYEPLRRQPDCAEKWLPLVCSLLVQLHAVDWRTCLPNAERSEPGNPRRVVADALAQNMDYIQRGCVPGLRPVVSWLTNHQHDVYCPAPVLTHGDLHPDNILLRNGLEPLNGGAVVIDWCHSDVSDYRFDVASSSLAIGAYAGWGLREEFVREYERQRGERIEGIDFFDALACFGRLWSFTASLSFGADRIGLKRDCERSLRQQASAMTSLYETLLGITGISVPEVEDLLNPTKC